MSLRGKLLVAEPTLGDSNFHRTVVLIIDHDVGGALGVVLNRPSPVDVRDVVPVWAPYVADPDRVFVGGPVSPQAAICLARRSDPREAEGWQPLFDDLGAIDLHVDPTEAPPGITGLRVFAGYAGWSPGQLEEELAAEGWYVVDAAPDDVFTGQPDSLWRAVLARQRGELRRVAFFPPDPALN